MTIKVNDLSVSFSGQSVINNFTYTFNDKGLYLFIAPNGSGKTTIFRSMLGLINSKNSGVLVDNKNVINSRGKTFYYESSNWFDVNLSGLDYLKFVKSQWQSQIAIDEIINLWEMQGYVNKSIKKYSLGMKQKLLISLYLVSDAKYMIMDEITNGLDEDSRKKLMQILSDLSKTKCIITSSHYKDEIIEYADYVLTIKKHKVVSKDD
ncbi:ABC transporter ATP-binding protein [Lactobacillus sp. Sy-1]|uniref:ATP-binding cassette domain-containing protein n=1 Tax=Lactobacillus sp. Sy-1 TaxID=2109645 RepID=UPI001C5A8273|nr:ABC transporter ATP-binding protein [Lactobacillus sp. Sy-1]MBW1606317.1 ABC transporter ATP-binding protein [Lactobacillus sp. Sy-1]